MEQSPFSPGRYHLELTLVQENVSWLDNNADFIEVEVGQSRQGVTVGANRRVFKMLEVQDRILTVAARNHSWVTTQTHETTRHVRQV